MLDWYLGYFQQPRPLTDAERDAVAQILSHTTSPHRVDGAGTDETQGHTHASVASVIAR